MTVAEREESRRDAASRANQRVLLTVHVPNWAKGLTAKGEQPRNNRRLTAAQQKLVDEYKARMATESQEPEVPMSETEIAWRKLRAEMGDISVPEVEVKLRY